MPHFDARAESRLGLWAPAKAVAAEALRCLDESLLTTKTRMEFQARDSAATFMAAAASRAWGAQNAKYMLGRQRARIRIGPSIELAGRPLRGWIGHCEEAKNIRCRRQFECEGVLRPTESAADSGVRVPLKRSCNQSEFGDPPGGTPSNGGAQQHLEAYKPLGTTAQDGATPGVGEPNGSSPMRGKP